MSASWISRNNLISDNDVEEAYNTVFGKEDENMFTKSDLKTGMIIETRKGDKLLVLLDCSYGYKKMSLSSDIIVDGHTEKWNRLGDYDDSLKSYTDSKLDIMKVYQVNHPYSVHTFDDLILIWERQEPQEMTVEEIEKELGYQIKIVSSKEGEIA